MDEESQESLELVHQDGYRFRARFLGTSIPELLTDEAPPVGGGAGPSPSQLLGTAVANCLAASLLFALRKFGNEPQGLVAEVTVRFGRNDQGRLRVAAIRVELRLDLAAAAIRMRERILAQFENFCVVTQSLRACIPVEVLVLDRDGLSLPLPG